MTHTLNLVLRICALCLLRLSAAPAAAAFEPGDRHSDLCSEQAVKVTMHDKSASASLATIPEATALVPPDARLAAGRRPELTSWFLERRNLHQILRV